CNTPSTPLLYTLSLHDALPIYSDKVAHNRDVFTRVEESGLSSALVLLRTGSGRMPPGDLLRNPLDFRSGVVYARDLGQEASRQRSEEHTSELQSRFDLVCRLLL